MKKMYLLLIILGYSLSVFSQQHGTGLIFADEDDYKDIPLASAPMMGTLPAQKDLSGWFPPAGNQGMQSSCVGWAVAYGLKSYQEAVERKRRPTNNLSTFSPSYIYNQIKLGGCDQGSHIEQALNLLRQEGVAKFSDFPYSEYSCSTSPGNEIKSKARPFTIADWRRVDFRNQIEVKSQIVKGFPIVIGMYVDDGFQNLTGDNIYYSRSGMERGGHAMVVVGYDDSKQAYKVFNSWGTDWGNNGFGWISYSIFENRVREAYTAQDVVIMDPDQIEDDVPDYSIDDVTIPEPVQNITSNAWLGQPLITHNVPVQTPLGTWPGMLIRVPGSINNAQGNQAQLIIRFYFPDGTPLLANHQELSYRDANGLAAAGTPAMPVLNNNANIANIELQIPYYALNLTPTNNMTQYQLAAVATLYINSFEKAKSLFTTLTVFY
ncbi:MAG: C1 family peptidase [Ignavibacteriaceae bacterium]